MLKYLYYKEIFAEVPGEITLGISLTGCTIHCPDCHSKELWEDIGTPLTIEELDRFLDENKGITCLLLLGGEHDIDSLTELFQHSFETIKALCRFVWVTEVVASIDIIYHIYEVAYICIASCSSFG